MKRLRLDYIKSDMFYSSLTRSVSEELQSSTELKCRAADSVPPETETGGTRLVLSSADYNLIWGVLTRRDHSTDMIYKVSVRHIMNFSDQLMNVSHDEH